jgi:hypothetical protein
MCIINKCINILGHRSYYEEAIHRRDKRREGNKKLECD